MNAKVSPSGIQASDESEWLLQIEAVNLSHFVYDTDDLSTIRGGGLILLNAVTPVVVSKWAEKELTEVMTGASKGIFRFSATEVEAAEVRDRIRKALETNGTLKYQRDGVDAQAQLRHATFVVALTPFEKNFDAARKRLLSSIRLAQLRQPSRAMPKEEDGLVCGLDPTLPASTEKAHTHDDKRISRSAVSRREYGRAQKQEFYTERTKGMGLDLSKFSFANDFREISGRAPTSAKHLQGKLAVLYLDGNRFGRILAEVGTDINSQTRFSNQLKEKQNSLLKDLLHERLTKDEAWQYDEKLSKRGLRFETLLWGGDEMMFVAPAWKGWELLEFVLGKSENWEFDNHALTYGAGLVFTGDKVPIGRLKNLAHDLADEAKRVWADPDKAKSNPESVVAVEVLESQDYLGSDLDGYRNRLFPVGSDAAARVLNLEKVQRLSKTRALLGSGFPRGKLHAFARYVLQGANPSSAKTLEDIRKEFNGYKTEMAPLIGAFANDSDLAWLHLHHLWDYI